MDSVIPCGHVLCTACSTQWCLNGKATCPMCRGPIVAMQSTTSQPCAKNVIHISFDGVAIPRYLGITLHSADRGVRVRALQRDGIARHSGVRVGDVITHINSIPTLQHSVATSILDGARVAKLPIRLTVRREWRFAFLRRFEYLLLM